MFDPSTMFEPPPVIAYKRPEYMEVQPAPTYERPPAGEMIRRGFLFAFGWLLFMFLPIIIGGCLACNR